MIIYWRDHSKPHNFNGIEMYQYNGDCIELLDKEGNIQYIIPTRVILYVEIDPRFKGRF